MWPATSCCSSPCCGATAVSIPSRKTTTSGPRANSILRVIQNCTSSRTNTPTTPPIGGSPTGPVSKPCYAAQASSLRLIRKTKCICAGQLRGRKGKARSIPRGGSSDDRGRQDLERAKQQVALGYSDRSRLGHVRGPGDRRRQGDPRRPPDAAARARRHLTNRCIVHPQHEI